MVVYNQWCRVEGTVIPNQDKEYGIGVLKHLDKEKIFYNNPEVQIRNPSSVINGCKFRIIPISQFGWTKIIDIDKNYADLIKKVEEEKKDANYGDFYYRPFVLTESSIVLYDDSTSAFLTNVSFIYVDKYAVAKCIMITASYNQQANVPMGQEFESKHLVITAVFEDGTTHTIVPEGYVIYNSKGEESKKVLLSGSNAFRAVYTLNGKTFTADFVVPGIKNLTGITAIYDGPAVAIGSSALKRYFVVTAKFTDNSTDVVGEFSFPEGTVISVENLGVIKIYYKGFTTTCPVTKYEVIQSNLMAFYNGPNIEVGHEFDKTNVKAKVYYKGSDSNNNFYEDIAIAECTFSTLRITFEGENYITITYPGKAGNISTQFSVPGIKPEVKLSYITAEYTGKPVIIGKSFSTEKIVCKAYYTNSTVSIIHNFGINSNIIYTAGDNVFNISWEEKKTNVVVQGLIKDDTTSTSFDELKIQNQYPVGVRPNMRYRGPRESLKEQNMSISVLSNIKSLYSRCGALEKAWKATVKEHHVNLQTKANTINTTNRINDIIESYRTDGDGYDRI